MFPKPWQSLALVGFVLLFVVLIFDGEERPAGISNVVDAAQNSAQQRAQEDDQAAPTDELAEAPTSFEDAENSADDFNAYEIEDYGAPQVSAAPRDPAVSQPGAAVRRADWPKGPPAPGTRNTVNAPPRIIPKDPSKDPDLQADLDAALKKLG